MRQEKYFALDPSAIQGFVLKALHWALQEEEQLAYYTSCGIAYPFGAFPHLLAVGALELHEWQEDPFAQLHALHVQQPDWRFGYIAYDCKNELHGLNSNNPATILLPNARFFRPKHLIHFEEGGIRLETTGNPDAVYQRILHSPVHSLRGCKAATPRAKMGKEEYLQKVETIRQHIMEGDCYELNLCFEFETHPYVEDPLMLFRQLQLLSPTPFSCFQRWGEQYLICASPERFLKKEGELLISQPIKGTRRRSSNPLQDEALKKELAASEKDKAENLMIVDLVRNDLARSCRWGSVAVPELFGIYSFRQVHQMVSTVTGVIKSDIPFTEALRAAFPMGSMTGAPKRIVMELIEKYETSRRGLYSGTAGFINPSADFDFNVVIRSMVYDAQQQLLSFSVGGAITWDSNPEQEYEECLLKAKALLQVLGYRNPTE